MSSYEKCIRKNQISDAEWLHGVIDVLQKTELFNFMVEDEEQSEQINTTRKRKYTSHNRTKDLWATPWGLMLKNVANIDDLNAMSTVNFADAFGFPLICLLK